MNQWKQEGRWLLLLYQRIFWYVSIAKAEIFKPFGFYNETLIVVTYLAVKGIDPGLWLVIAVYLGALFLMASIGKLLAHFGIVKYNNSISNKENAEITQIKADIAEALKILKELQTK